MLVNIKRTTFQRIVEEKKLIVEIEIGSRDELDEDFGNKFIELLKDKCPTVGDTLVVINMGKVTNPKFKDFIRLKCCEFKAEGEKVASYLSLKFVFLEERQTMEL